MLRKIITTWLLLIILLSVVPTASAERGRGAVLFLLIGPGARATGMGEAFVALADDPTATYWNPAGLGLHPLSSEWQKFELPSGEDIQSVGVVTPKKFSIGGKRMEIWAATETQIWRNKGNKWTTEEIYVTAPEEKVDDIVKSYLGRGIATDQEEQRIIEKVIEYNALDASPGEYLPPDTELKIPFEYFLSDHKITDLHGSSKELIIGTDNGLYRRISGSWEKYTSDRGPLDQAITCIAGDDKDNFIVGTENGAYLNRFGKWSSFTTANGLPSNTVTAVYMKDVNDIWVGTDLGVARIDNRDFVRTYEFTVNDSAATWDSIMEDYFDTHTDESKRYLKSAVMVANDILNEETPPPSTLKGIYDNVFQTPVTAIYEDKFGNMWFGTVAGLKRFDGQRWQNYGYKKERVAESTSYREIVEVKWPSLKDEEAARLIDNLRRYNRSNSMDVESGTEIMLPVNPASGMIYDIRQSGTGDLFVATEYGLIEYNYKKQRFASYVQQDLANSEVKQIVAVQDRVVFNAQDRINSYASGKKGLTFMHVQWLPELTDDMYYEFLSGTYYLEGWGTIGGGITYMYMGESPYTDSEGNVLGNFRSYDLAMTLSYGTTIANRFAAGLNFKLIHSSLAKGVYVGGELKDGTATTFAVDAGVNYKTPLSGLRFGAAVQNLGPNVQYIDAAQADPLPRNLKVGLAYTPIDNEFNKLVLAADFNKELINNPFADPGWMEWHESVKNLGVEYTYADFISFRGGYMLDYDYIKKNTSTAEEDEEEVLRKEDWKSISYFTVGAGIKYGNYSFDFGYIPEQKDKDEGTLALSNIMRFSFSAEF